MADTSVKWMSFPFQGRGPARFAGVDASFGLYRSEPQETQSQFAGPVYLAVLKTAELESGAERVMRDEDRKATVEVSFPQCFPGAPDWDLAIDATGTGAAVMQLFGGGWNELLYVALSKGHAAKPVWIRGQDFSAPRLVAGADGSFTIFARSKFDGLVAIDPADPSAKPQVIGDHALGLCLDIGGGDSAWLFLADSDLGPLSPTGVGAATGTLAICPTGKIPSPSQKLFDGKPLFEIAAAATGNGLVVLATAPSGVHACEVDVHGTTTDLPLGSLSGTPASPSVAVQSDRGGGLVALMSVLSLAEDRYASGIALAQTALAAPAP